MRIAGLWQRINEVWQQLHLTPRFFLVALMVVLFYGLSFAFPWLHAIARSALVIAAVFTLADVLLLFLPTTRMEATRSTGKLFSLSDPNPVLIDIQNTGRLKLTMDVYDELPYQFQERDFHMHLVMVPGEEQRLRYELRPVLRGEYHFGHINAIVRSPLGLAARTLRLGSGLTVPVYPSVVQMKKYELMAFASISTFQGIKKVRKLGHSYEFEQIKNYVLGDDVRSINWKATSRKHSLMVNQYEDERSQQVYTIIDKGRSMHMPFNKLALLDYAINTSLVISNIALRKHDKVGLITYSHRLGSAIPAEKSSNHLKKILHALYHEKPQPYESNYDLLYRAVKNVIHARSLVFLYINFESTYAMERALPVLQRINRLHLLVVMIFENSELSHYAVREAEYVSDVYAQTIARKLMLEKKQMVSKLRKYGIQTILSKPEDLSINTVNKYLELKARGLI